MIYQQNLTHFIFSFLFFALSYYELLKFNKKYFLNIENYFISLSILIHPICLDGLMGPNTLSGYFPFFFLLKYLNLANQQQSKQLLGFDIRFIYLIIAGSTNFYYILFPLHHLVKSSPVNSKGKILYFSFLLAAFLFSFSLYLPSLNIITFASYFIANTLIPINISSFHYGHMGFSIELMFFFLTFLFASFFFFRKRNDSILFYFILLPLLLISFKNFNNETGSWIDVVFNYSNLLPVVFASLIFLGLILKKFFRYYMLCIFLASVYWSTFWISEPKMIEQSFYSLPENYSEIRQAKKLLALEYAYNDQVSKGTQLLQELINEHFDVKDLKEEIDFLQRQK